MRNNRKSNIWLDGIMGVVGAVIVEGLEGLYFGYEGIPEE